jgi:hypothetical protein
VPELKIPTSAPGADGTAAALGKIAVSLKKMEEAANAAGFAMAKTGGAGKKASFDLNELAGVESLAIAATLGLAEKALHAAEALATMAGESERAQLASRSLGEVADRVSAATGGMVTATQAYNLQQQVTRAGLRLSNDELVVLSRGARDHARAMGTDLPTALQDLSHALTSGSGEALRGWGINIREGTSRGRAMETTLAALTREQRGQAPVTRTLAEDTTRLGTSVTETTGALAGMVAQGLGLQGLFSSAATEMNRLTREFREFIEFRNQQAGSHTRDEENLRSLEQYNAAQHRLAASARALGMDVNVGPRADQLSAADRNRLTSRMNQALDTGGHGPEELRRNLTDFAPGIGQDADASQAREAAARNLALHPPATPTRPQGPRDTAGVREVVQNQGAIRAAQIELGIANQSLALLGVRFERLGQVKTREEELTALRENAAHTEHQTNEKEDAYLHRIVSARQALLTALAEERDRRKQLQDMVAAETVTEASGALGALGATRGGGRLNATQQRQLEAFGGTMARLEGLVAAQRSQVAELQGQLAQVNLPLTEQLRIRTLLASAVQTMTGNEATLFAMQERGRETQRETLDLHQAEFDTWSASYQAARQARQEHQRLTDSETLSVGQRANSIQRLTELESGYRQLVAQATQEAAAARTEEGRNAALSRRLQLLQRLSSAEGQRRALEIEEARSDYGTQIAMRFNAAMDSQATHAERFGDIAVGMLSQFQDAFATAMVAVLEGEKSFADSMKGMLKALLESLAKQAIMESMKNLALGIAMVARAAGAEGADAGADASAASYFAAAAAWGAVGALAGVGAGAVGRAGAQSAPASSGSSARPATSGAAMGAGGQGGGLTLNIRVDGVAISNEGVQQSVVRAVDAAGLRSVYPRGMRRIGH